MTVYTITGSVAGSISLSNLSPQYLSLDADSASWSGTIPGLTWYAGETQSPMPYPPTADTGWYQDEIFDCDVSYTVNSLTVSGGGSVTVYLVMQNIAPGGYTNGFNETDVASIGTAFSLPATQTGTPSMYLNWYQHLSLRFQGGWFPSATKTVSFDIDWSMSADRPDPPVTGGIYLGSIVLGSSPVPM